MKPLPSVVKTIGQTLKTESPIGLVRLVVVAAAHRTTHAATADIECISGIDQLVWGLVATDEHNLVGSIGKWPMVCVGLVRITMSESDVSTGTCRPAVLGSASIQPQLWFWNIVVADASRENTDPVFLGWSWVCERGGDGLSDGVTILVHNKFRHREDLEGTRRTCLSCVRSTSLAVSDQEGLVGSYVQRPSVFASFVRAEFSKCNRPTVNVAKAVLRPTCVQPHLWLSKMVRVGVWRVDTNPVISTRVAVTEGNDDVVVAVGVGVHVLRHRRMAWWWDWRSENR